jgi:TonB family protein
MHKPDPFHANGRNCDDPFSEQGSELDGGSGSSEGKDLPADPARGSVGSERMAQEIVLASMQQDLVTPRRDYRTGALTAAVIALSLLLGWMMGRAGWNMAVNRDQRQISAVPEETVAANQLTQYPVSVWPGDTEAATEAKPTRSSPVSTTHSNPVLKQKTGTAVSDGGLVMYEQGKVVFRTPASEARSCSANTVGSVETESAAKADSPATSAQMPGLPTNTYLLTRVVPEYPEEARQQRVQGPVVMSIFVGTDGSVRELRVISGDPKLVQAAADAVRQWHFRPHRFNGKPAEFETRITVNFALP